MFLYLIYQLQLYVLLYSNIYTVLLHHCSILISILYYSTTVIF